MCPHKKVSKESVIGGGANVALPRAKYTLPHAPLPCAFLRMLTGMHRAAERKSEHFRVKLLFFAGLPVSEGWYIGGGGFVKSPLLWRLLFVLFLPTQEKNIFIAKVSDNFP